MQIHRTSQGTPQPERRRIRNYLRRKEQGRLLVRVFVVMIVIVLGIEGISRLMRKPAADNDFNLPAQLAAAEDVDTRLERDPRKVLADGGIRIMPPDKPQAVADADPETQRVAARRDIWSRILRRLGKPVETPRLAALENLADALANQSEGIHRSLAVSGRVSNQRLAAAVGQIEPLLADRQLAEPEPDGQFETLSGQRVKEAIAAIRSDLSALRGKIDQADRTESLGKQAHTALQKAESEVRQLLLRAQTFRRVLAWTLKAARDEQPLSPADRPLASDLIDELRKAWRAERERRVAPWREALARADHAVARTGGEDENRPDSVCPVPIRPVAEIFDGPLLSAAHEIVAAHLARLESVGAPDPTGQYEEGRLFWGRQQRVIAAARRSGQNAIDLHDAFRDGPLEGLRAVAEGAAPSSSQRDELEDLQQVIDEISLQAVEDGRVLRIRHVERYAWFRLWEKLQQASQTELNKQARLVGFVNLFKQPHQYRGKLVTVRGTVRNAFRYDAAENMYGVKNYYVFWLKPAGGPDSPIVIYTTELPPGFPRIKHRSEYRPADLYLDEKVQFTGYFFKRWAYGATDGTRTAPLILAKAPQQWLDGQAIVAARGENGAAAAGGNQPAAAKPPAQELPAWRDGDKDQQGGLPPLGVSLLVIGLLLVVAIGIAVYVYRKSKGVGEANSDRQTDPAEEAASVNLLRRLRDEPTASPQGRYPES